MSSESLEEFYSQILGFEWPWEVEEIIRDPCNSRSACHRSHMQREKKAPARNVGKRATVHDRKTRKWRHLDSCNHKTIIESNIPRVNCPEHGVLQIKVPWAEKNSRFTAELERHVLPLAEDGSDQRSRQYVRPELGRGRRAFRIGRYVVGWRSGKGASPRNIGVDETSFQKRHEYVTVILDKDSNTVLDVLQDRKAETLSTWFGSQEMADLQGLESISMDMWDPYIKAARDNFENWEGIVAFDRYHVAQHLNKAGRQGPGTGSTENLSKSMVRRELSGTKFDWLRTSSTTDNRTGNRRAFMQLSRMNLKTAKSMED